MTIGTTAVEREADPFYDPPESQLIGVAHIYLESLSCVGSLLLFTRPHLSTPGEPGLQSEYFMMLCVHRYLLDIRQTTIIVDYQGQTAGTLEVDLLPCGPDGSLDTDVMVDAPEELIDTRLDLLVVVKGATGLGKQHAMHGSFVGYRFYLDDEVERSPIALPKMLGSLPSYNYNSSRHITVEQVTDQFVRYLQEGSMTFEVWSQPTEELGSPVKPPRVGPSSDDPDVTDEGATASSGERKSSSGEEAAGGVKLTPRRYEARIAEVEKEMSDAAAKVSQLENTLAREREESARAREALAEAEAQLTAARKKSSACVIS